MRLGDLTAHFSRREFASKDGAPMPASYPDTRLLGMLEVLRYACGEHPVTILSGWRSVAHNAAVGGAVESRHLTGEAADIRVDGVSPAKVAAVARELFEGWGGVGEYATFVHIDCRAREARWRG